MAGLSRADLAKRHKQMAEDAKRMDINLVAKKWKVTRTTVANACREHGLRERSEITSSFGNRKYIIILPESFIPQGGFTLPEFVARFATSFVRLSS